VTEGSELFPLPHALCYTSAYIVIQTVAFGELMKTEMLSTRIDGDTKLAFTSVCEDMGLSTSQAIKLFAKAVINYGGIPFELKAKQPNAGTLAAIAELESGQANTANNVEEMLDELNISKLNNA
jgi:DNA-damage-inducible protein J